MQHEHFCPNMIFLFFSFVTAQCGLQFSSRGVRPGITTVLARNLDKNTMGYLQWRWGIQSSMNTSIVRDTKTSHFAFAMQVGSQQLYYILILAKTPLNQQLLLMVVPKCSIIISLQLGIPHTFVMLSYQYKFQDDDQTKIKGSVKYVFTANLTTKSLVEISSRPPFLDS